MLFVDSGRDLGTHSSQETHLLDLAAGLVDWLLPPAVLGSFGNFADLAVWLFSCGINVLDNLCCCVGGSGPISGANIVSLANLLAPTAGTNTRNTALKIVHTVY